MYRPTVRYADVYKDYVDDLFQATHLDRNQIIRAALFTAAYSSEFLKLMNENKRPDVLLPSPLWRADDTGLWMESNPKIDGEWRDVSFVDNAGKRKIGGFNDVDRGSAGREEKQKEPDRRQREESRRIREVREGGGIRIRLG